MRYCVVRTTPPERIYVARLDEEPTRIVSREEIAEILERARKLAEDKK